MYFISSDDKIIESSKLKSIPQDFHEKVEVMRGALFDLVYILVLFAIYQHINDVVKKI